MSDPKGRTVRADNLAANLMGGSRRARRGAQRRGQRPAPGVVYNLRAFSFEDVPEEFWRANGFFVDSEGRQIEDYRADVIFQCARCRAMLWHAWADLTVATRIITLRSAATTTPAQARALGEYRLIPRDEYTEADGFAPGLLGLTEEAGGIQRFAHLHAPALNMVGWQSEETSETQDCPNPKCARAVTISRRRTYLRLRALWEEAEAAIAPRRLFVDA